MRVLTSHPALSPPIKALACAVGLAAALACGPEVEKAELVLLNGRVWTGNPASPWAEAIAVRGNTISAVGSGAEIERSIAVHTHQIDVGGRLVIPGLNDAHLHFLSGSLSLQQVLLDDTLSVEQMLVQVEQWAEAHPEARWVVGRGWNYTQFPGGAFPSRADLDRVVGDRPVALESYDGHTLWVNSRALAEAEIDRTTVFDGYGEVLKDPATGEPTGILTEGAYALVEKVMPEPTDEQEIAAIRGGLVEAARYGITAILNATGTVQDFRLYDRLLKGRTLTVRTITALTLDPDGDGVEIEEMKRLAEQYAGPRLKAGYVKIFADGVIESHTAAMLEPYSDDATTSGTPKFTSEDLNAWVKKLDEAGLNILVHAIGDRAVRMVLDAYEAAAAENPPRERRHRIEHVEMISEPDIARFRSLGVVASMQPLHGGPDPDGVWARNIGTQRLPFAFAWRSMRDAGARLVHGSDWPVVALNPFHGIYTAVTRGYLDGRPEPRWVPRQRLTVEQALAGYTSDPAWADFEESKRGTIEIGKWADLAVLSNNLFEVAPEEIPATESLLTLFDGKIVHTSGPFVELR
jgi:predicted amidohydrolase YtcJ